MKKSILIVFSFSVFFLNFAHSQINEDAIYLCSQAAEFAKHPKWSLGNTHAEADYIFVDKKNKLMHLMRDQKIIRTYKVALGRGPASTKICTGDNKTPEGDYKIEYKNSASDYHLSLRISYPEQKDIDNARKVNCNPGGDIMIHGFPENALARLFINHPSNWTKGCVAVTDSEIEEIWSVVHTKTPVLICH